MGDGSTDSYREVMGFRLEIHHTTHIDGIPVERLDEAIAEWRALPSWRRLIRRSPLVRIGSKITVEPELLPGVFDTAVEADEAARTTARELDGVIRPDSAVMVVDVDGASVGGWYPGDRGRC